MNRWEQDVLRFLAKSNKGVPADVLCAQLHVKKKERPRFLMTLRRMEIAGQIAQGKKGKYTYGSSLGNCLNGILISLSKGFGFVRIEGERTGAADYFVPGRSLMNALPGDRVLLLPGEDDGRGPQGVIVRILQPGNRVFTGKVFEDEKGRLRIRPDAAIRYALHAGKLAKTTNVGDKVRFCAEWKNGKLYAMIETVYGSAESARVCADAIVDACGIPTEFSDEAVSLAEQLSAAGISQTELEGREDLRDHMIFTIDGADAKDLDDAVSLESTQDGWMLGVHIADVSHYVTMGSPIDREAAERGTSVYFADRVIPMLPQALSNGICSLNAGEDKLTLSVLLEYDRSFALRGSRIVPSVIRSHVRGVYSEINDLFQETAETAVREKYASIMEPLQQMRRLADKLARDARQRGTLELYAAEAQFVLDERGEASAVFPRQIGESEGMIEQFMIAANSAVAELARKKKIPFIYRSHEHPNMEKLESLMEMVQALGLKAPLRIDDVPLSAMQDLLTDAAETPYARLVSSQLLRCMAKAKYSENPLGHYGLALKDYCHFTSPIRRYPDLSIHRILHDLLDHVPKKVLYDRYESFVRTSADLSTACEIRAMNAERDCEACYKAEYMAGHLGQSFSGVISSVSDFGFYVELPNTVEGMVRLESLKEANLRYDNVAALTDERGRQVYRVGDEFEVQVASCDVSTGRIAFVPAQ